MRAFKTAQAGGVFGASVLMLVAVLGVSASAYAETKTFKPGPEQEFKVPAGVTEVQVEAVGGAGGAGGTCKGGVTYAGGSGAKVTATLSVSGVKTLYFDFGGGGKGGANLENCYPPGGDGGGASDVRTEAGTLSSRQIVAGGGGGGGSSFEFGQSGCQEEAGAGGSADALEGEAGFNGTATRTGDCPPALEASGGGGGKASAGGEGGSQEGLGVSCVAGSGGEGTGGNGVSSIVPSCAPSGGGGGGYFGGGGGGGGRRDSAGGGAGSSFVAASAKGGKVASGAGLAQQVVITYTVPAAPSEVSTTLSGGGQSGEKITVPEGTAVTDHATLTGENAATATGKISYKQYSDKECLNEVGQPQTEDLEGAGIPPSGPETLAAGTYYWQAAYSGDQFNNTSHSICGAEVETVTAKATATCGKTTVGKSSDSLLANFKRVNQCTLPVNATVSELSIYLSPNSHSGTQLIKGIFYADSKGKPIGLLGTTVQVSFTSKSKAGWYHLAFPEPLKLLAGSYWIGMITGSTKYVGAEHYDKVANAEDSNTNSYTAGASNPFGSFNKSNEQMSLYATYTPSGPGCSSTQLIASC
jgi:hypothetical protein